MDRETLQLVEYSAGISYEDIPVGAIQAAKNTICDGVGACIYGFRLPWSQIVYRYAEKIGSGGRSSVLGAGASNLSPANAALVNGSLAHSFELDGAMRPGMGAHPYATIFPAALAIAQELGSTGKELLTAFVAATEVTLRIGRASKRSNETRGFHSPGTTGPFGAALAAGLLLKLDNNGLSNAMGIAGSMACGLTQFSHGKKGGMVKRLHFGRAAESGVLAASLAAQGFDGPHDILEGQAGFFRAYCNEFDLSELTWSLGKMFLTEQIYMKRFACHGSAQYPVEALRTILVEQGISADDIEAVEVTASHELVERHGSRSPADLALAQYSVPFCIALACIRDPRDPRSFDEGALKDSQIYGMLERVRYVVDENLIDAMGSQVTVILKGGTHHQRSIPQIPNSPSPRATREQVYEKYSILTRDLPADTMNELFERLQSLEDQTDLLWLSV